MIAKRIAILAADLGSMALNTYYVNPLNKLLGWLGVKIPQICLRKIIEPDSCGAGQVGIEDILGCSPSLSTIAYQRCYFARQEAICLSEDDTYDNYQSLFKAPDTDELTQQYEDIVGDSFTVVDPTFQGVFDSLDNTAYSPDVAAAKEICDANLWQSMALDKVRKHRTYFSPEFSYALTTCAVRRLVCPKKIIIACVNTRSNRTKIPDSLPCSDACRLCHSFLRSSVSCARRTTRASGSRPFSRRLTSTSPPSCGTGVLHPRRRRHSRMSASSRRLPSRTPKGSPSQSPHWMTSSLG